jgi:hypothetical protein
MACPDLEVLAALAEGGLSDPVAVDHMISCGRCRREVQALAEALAPSRIASEPLPRVWLLAAQAAGKPSPACPSRRRRLLPWAAAVLITLAGGVSWQLRQDSRPAGTAGETAEAALPPSAPAWLLQGAATGIPDDTPLLLSGSVLCAAGKGTCVTARDGEVQVDAGELLAEVPEGVRFRITGPDGACVSTLGGTVWVSVPTAPQVSGWRFLLREALAAEAHPPVRVWVVQGSAELTGHGAGPSMLSAASGAEFRGGRWERWDRVEAPAGVRRLRETLGRRFRPPAWTVREQVEPAGGEAWRLGHAARLGLSEAPPEATLRIRMDRPSPEAEVRIAFPQPGGPRAWLIGDWQARGLGEAATLSVAYGPWGACGYADGRRLWVLGPDGPSGRLLPAPRGMALGIAVSGAGVVLREVRLMEVAR